MMRRPHALPTIGIVFALSWVATDAGGPVQDDPAFYDCAGDAVSEAADIGVTLCDAAPTEALSEQIEIDNLQLRSGALIIEARTGGVGDVAGVRAGDVIYRVGGVNLTNAEDTTARLALIARDSDTVVNFLRRGRPYRVKIRRQ